MSRNNFPLTGRNIEQDPAPPWGDPDADGWLRRRERQKEGKEQTNTADMQPKAPPSSLFHPVVFPEAVNVEVFIILIPYSLNKARLCLTVSWKPCRKSLSLHVFSSVLMSDSFLSNSNYSCCRRAENVGVSLPSQLVSSWASFKLYKRPSSLCACGRSSAGV